MGADDEHDPRAQDDRGTAQAPAEAVVEGFLRLSLRIVRRLAVALIGTTVVLIGVVMTVTPGPAVVVIPVGLAILALEFAWARRLLRNVRDRAERARDSYWHRG